jgi:putative transposase
VINHNRVYRRYRADGLFMRRRKCKRVAVPPRGAQEQTWKRGEAWTMDFMQDALIDGRRFRTLNVLDRANRECLASEVFVEERLPTRIVPGRHHPHYFVLSACVNPHA